jgi:hypothetical protein
MFGIEQFGTEMQKHARSKCLLRPYFVRASASYRYPNCPTRHQMLIFKTHETKQLGGSSYQIELLPQRSISQVTE